jgi:hypothetical protein
LTHQGESATLIKMVAGTTEVAHSAGHAVGDVDVRRVRARLKLSTARRRNLSTVA